MKSNTINKKEIEKFSKISEEWWDPNGKFKPLHNFNPIRISYLKENIIRTFNLQKKDKILSGIKILDIGCGGGLLCEPMARMGAEVLGIDVVEKNIKVASLHAKKMNLDIKYRHISAEDLLREKKAFDVILNMEVVEHVENPGFFIEMCSNLLNSNGLMFCSTINKNLKSYIFAILGAEYVMQWLPKGTHDWNKFIKPNELKKLFLNSDLKVKDTKGFVFNPISWGWELSKSDFTVNYAVCATK